MISNSEIQKRAQSDGVSEEQIWRDWVISHVLQALSTIQKDTPLTFYGGTALCRTWCPNLRYSEDVDLLVGDFQSAQEIIPTGLKQLLRREFPDLSWSPGPAQDGMITGLLATGVHTIKTQLVSPRVREDDIPVAPTEVALRYSDLPATAVLTVPTAEGFAAMKLMAWHQRQAPRDLVDLAALAGAGAITANAIELTQHVSGTRIGSSVLDQKLTPAVANNWHHQVGHQMRHPPAPEDCLQTLVAAANVADNMT